MIYVYMRLSSLLLLSEYLNAFGVKKSATLAVFSESDRLPV